MTPNPGPLNKAMRPTPRSSLNPRAAEFVPSYLNGPHHDDGESERGDDLSSHSSRNTDLHTYLGSAFDESSTSDSGDSEYDNCYDEHALEEGLLRRDPPNSINTEYVNDEDRFHGPDEPFQYHAHPQVLVVRDIDQNLHPFRHDNRPIWRPRGHHNATGSRTLKLAKQYSVRGVLIPQTGIDDVSWESEFQSFMQNRPELTSPWEKDIEKLALDIHQITDEVEGILHRRAEQNNEIHRLLESHQAMEDLQTERLYGLTDRLWRLVSDVEEYRRLLNRYRQGEPLNWQINAKMAGFCDAVHRLRSEQERMSQRNTRSSQAFDNATRDLRDAVDDVSVAMDITRMKPAVDDEVTQQIARHLEALTMDEGYESDKDVRSKSV
jgi:hypothetical protein